jgi:hypothetical protein
MSDIGRLVFVDGKWRLEICQRYSDGFVEPILWGVKNGYPLAEIAEGLGLSVELVIDVIESRSALTFPRHARKPGYDANRARRTNWRRAVQGARATQASLALPQQAGALG